VRSRTIASWPSARSRSQTAAVRRHCQTIARWIGALFARSQTIVVSRWLVMPDGGDVVAGDPGRFRACVAGPLDRRPEILGVVRHPARPRVVLRHLGVATGPDGARGSTTSAVEPVGPLVEREHEAGAIVAEAIIWLAEGGTCG